MQISVALSAFSWIAGLKACVGNGSCRSTQTGGCCTGGWSGCAHLDVGPPRKRRYRSRGVAAAARLGRGPLLDGGGWTEREGGR